MATSQGKSFVELLADGATTTFSVPFPYLSPEHVTVTVDDVTTAFTFLTSASIEITPAPADQSTVLIKRVTPDDPLVDFSQGNQFSRTKLLTGYLQILYVAQEAFDEGTTIQVDASAAFADIVDQINTNTATLQAAIDAYEVQFASDIADAELDFSTQIAALQEFPADLQATLDALAAQYDQLALGIAALQADIDTAEADIDGLQAFTLPTPNFVTGGTLTVSGLDYDEPLTFDDLALLDQPYVFLGLGGASATTQVNLGHGRERPLGQNGTPNFAQPPLFNLPGGSVEFEGGIESLHFGNLAPDSPLLEPKTRFTAMCFVQIDDLTEAIETRNTLFGCIQAGGWGVQIGKIGGGNELDIISFLVRTQSGAYERAEIPLATVGITEGVPFSVAVVYDNPNLLLYINGQLADSTVGSPDTGDVFPPSSNGFILGADLTAGNTNADTDTAIQGRLDTFLFYQRALSANRILRIHESAVAGTVVTDDYN